MTSKELSNILDGLDFWIGIAEGWQKVFNELNEVIAPTSYKPIIVDTYVQAFIDGVCLTEPDLREDLAYYSYELPGMKESIATDRLGKEYNLKNRKDFIKFTLGEWK
jgi:hypothetical protein